MSQSKQSQSKPRTSSESSRTADAPQRAAGAGATGADDAQAVQKDPDEWVTGDESMTASQASYLKTLSAEAGTPVDETLTKAEASKRIDELRAETGRGIDH